MKSLAHGVLVLTALATFACADSEPPSAPQLESQLESQPQTDEPDTPLMQRWTLLADSREQWWLPTELREVSGLVLTPDQRLLAMDDELAIIYQVDYENARIVKAFAFGIPTLDGDFEGIAYHDGMIYLVTSKGRLYRAAEGAEGQRVEYETWKTGVGDECEIEGLAKRGDELLLLCKDRKSKASIDELSIFVWSIANESIDWEQTIELPADAIEDRLGMKKLRPSGLAIHPDGGALIIVAARQRALIELSPQGEFVDARVLPLGDWHPQAEGIEITQDGRLILADEGEEGFNGRLAVYRPRRAP